LALPGRDSAGILMDQKVIVIVGASAGIGEALAELLARQGHALVLAARGKDALEAVAARCGKSAHAVVADATSRADVRRVVDTALGRFGHVDVWINNVGHAITRPPSLLTDEDIDDMMRSNVKSALYGVQEILPHFKERGAGHIVNISSMLGRIPFAMVRSAYCGAKHFLNALTGTLRAELEPSHPGIQVSLVSPGVVRTDFGLKARHGGPDSRDFPESQSAEEAAAAIAWVIETRRPDVYTRRGSQQRVAGYYASIGVDPEP
jgi:NADP-dependent 3-hydroxy acid dehydrogenase YdfG